MLQVDNFLDSLIEDYRTLYQENISLKNKMKVLVDKVEEYRATEDAMRMTLHSAQKMADAMVKEGEAKKQAAIDQAVSAVEARSQEVRAQMEQEEQAVRTRLEGIQKDLADEQARLEAARAATTAYVAQLKELYTKQIQYIGSLSSLTAETAQPQAAPAPAAQPAEEPVVTVPPEQQEEVAQDIEASMAKIFEGPAESAAPSGDMGDTRVFDQIQFGKDYEIECSRGEPPGQDCQARRRCFRAPAWRRQPPGKSDDTIHKRNLAGSPGRFRFLSQRKKSPHVPGGRWVTIEGVNSQPCLRITMQPSICPKPTFPCGRVCPSGSPRCFATGRSWTSMGSC